MTTVIDFSTPIEGLDQKRVEAELASRTAAGVVLNRFEVGQMAAIGACDGHESSTHSAIRSASHRVMWCFRSPDGGPDDIACLIEVPAEKIRGERHIGQDNFWRMVIPIQAIHPDDQRRIMSYAYRNRQGFIVGTRAPEPSKRGRRKSQQAEATA